MSVTIRNRRRISLLASSSLVAASLLVGVAGLSSLVVAPGVALAADECGDPSVNAGADDIFVCAGAFVGIDYTTTTDGDLTLNMEDGVVVTAGMAITGNAGERLTVRATTNVVGAGDPTIVNPIGYAIDVQGQGPAVIVDLRSTDVGVDAAAVIGSGRGINATNTAGEVQVRMNEGSVNAAAGFGVNAVGSGDVLVYLSNGTTVTSTGTAVRAISSGGSVDIVTSGLISGSGVGIFANGVNGVTIIAGEINVTGAQGISATTTGGAISLITNDAVTGQAGIVTNSNSGLGTTINLGGDVTGTAGNGITSAVGDFDLVVDANGNAITGTGGTGVAANVNGNGNVTLNLADVSGDTGVSVDSTTGNGTVSVTSTGAITSGAGNGVLVNANGAATVTVNDVSSTGLVNAVEVTSATSATVTVNGTVTGQSGVAAIVTGAGDASIDIVAGASSEATNPFGFGASAFNFGTGNATVTVDGTVVDGGVNVTTINGGANLFGTGSISMLTGFDAAGLQTDSGAITVIYTGSLSSLQDGLDTLTTSGLTSITLTGATVTAGDDGIEASSTSGQIIVNTIGGTIGATGDGINAVSDGGVVVVNDAVITAGATGIVGSGAGGVSITTTADVTGATGISATDTGGLTATVSVEAGATVTGTAGDGAIADSATGIAQISNFGALIGTGGEGAQATTVDGLAQVINQAGGTISATGAAGVSVTASGVGNAIVSDVGDGISGTTGIFASATSGVAIVVSNNVTGTAGDGINAIVTSGLVQVIAGGSVASTGGDGIDASSSAGGTVVVVGSASIDASDGFGVRADAAAGGDVIVVYDGAIGTALDPTGLGGIAASVTTGAGGVTVVSSSTINTLGDGVSGAHAGTAGDVVVSYDGTMVAGAVGVEGSITGVTNASAVTVSIGDGSSITAGTTGVLAENLGLGEATTVIGAGVTIDPDDYGSYTFSAANDATVTIGDNVVIVVGNTDGDNVAYGVYAESGQAADDAVGDESVEITIGTGASITIDDGAAGDADGAGGVIGVATGAAGGVDIDIGDGLNLAITGNNAIGVGGNTVGGDIFITTGTGTIDILGLDNTDLTGNFSGTAGVGALSATGNILIQSATTIAVNNGTLDAAGIFAESGGAGTVTVVSTAQILSSDTGISAEAVDGDVVVNSSAFIGAVIGDGISATNTGTGNTSVFSTASITSTVGNGISAVNSGTDGFVFVVASGGTITAGFDGIAAGATNAANTQIVQIDNSSAINANTGGGGGYGIFGFQDGSGSLVIGNSGAIGGSAFSGIVGLDTNAAGQIAITNTGAIGSVGDAVTSYGIIGTATAGASINIQATGGGIWSEFTGIRANSTSTGNVQVFTTATSPITVTGAGGAGIWANTLGGTLEVANNAAINSAGAGIVATNTTGTISVGTAGAVTATGGDAIFTSGTTGATTILANAALSGSDDGIDATVTDAALTVTNNATVTGADNGILTSNGGTGVTTLNVNANVTATGAGSAAINAATTGTGAVNVLIANGLTIQDVNGSAIRTGSGGGAVTINTGTGSTIVGAGAGATSWVVDMNNAIGGVTTLNIGAGTTVRSTDNTITGYDDLALRGVGGSVVINNAGRINGRVRFVDLTGNVVFNNSSLTSWHTTGASIFSAGADVLNNTGAIFTNANGVATSFDFGAGADTFTNSGLLVVGEPTLAASTLTITNLETWNNSGRIVFGSSGTTMAAVSDAQINDRILASGTTFTGSGSSLLSMDASLGAVIQSSCAVLSAADCLSLTGGSTAGSTSILVNDTSGNAFGAFNPTGIVLVDVAGAGSTAATHFSLNTASDFWRADLNSADGVLDKGLFFYDLTLNLNKQHVLVGLPDSEAFEFTTFGAAVSSIWQTTTGVWFERQADLRTQLPSLDDSGAGVWMKITGSAAERDRIQGYDLFGVTYDFDTSYEQNTVSLIGGLDFIGGGSGKAWVVGGQIGYVDSDVSFDNSTTLTSFEGMTLGVYGTYLSGPLFVDAIVNANMLDYDHQAISLAPAGSNVFTGSVDSLGFQVEGGWTMPLGANGFFEPLGSVSYLSSSIDAVDVPGAEVDFDDVTSLRVSLGGRLGLNADHGTFSSKWALVARYWNEFEGENDVTFHSAGPDFTLSDDFSGSFGELGASVNVFGADDRFSAFFNVGTKFQDDYQAVDGSLGIRWRW